MPRYKLTIEYDGTDFCGWQKQFPHADSVPGRLTQFRADDPHETEFSAPAIGAIQSHAQRSQPTQPEQATADRDHEPAPELDPSTVDRPRAELRTVQSVVERAVRLAVRQPINLIGSSRTDSGVHARGQVCAFSTVERADAAVQGPGPDRSIAPEAADSATAASAESDGGGEGKRLTNFERFGGGWPVERGVDALVRAVNARLPSDVLVRSCEHVRDDFNPIADTQRKAYSYTIWNSQRRPLWERRSALHVWHELDVERMSRVAQLLVGEHDFAGFAAAGHGRVTTVRTLFACTVRAESGDSPHFHRVPGERPPRRIIIDVVGSGFLWNMVRIIAGTLLEAGKAKIGPDRVVRALRTGERNLAGPTAPPHGLCLEWIEFA